MKNTTEFETLMKQVQSGSENAIEQLANTYTPYIIKAVRSLLPHNLRSKEDSADFAQSVWASMLIKQIDFTRLKSANELVAYLVRAGRNKVIDRIRHFRTRKKDVSREEGLTVNRGKQFCRSRSAFNPIYARDDSPSVAVALRETWNSVYSRISDRDRRIVEMHLNGDTFEVISDALKISTSTARRSIQQLAHQLSG